MSLTGKVAVITGASSGIGHATAKALAAQGATVVVTGRREDRLAALAREIVQDGGIADTRTCDVTDEDQATAMIKEVVNRHGRVDVLVNNAGVMLLSRIERGLTDEWRQMTDVNLHGVLFPTHAVIPVMKAQGSGAIVTISSTAARRSRPLGGVYAATKAAVAALSESVRLEVLKDGIGVTVIIPGAVDTELATHITDKEAQGGIAALKQNLEFLQPEDVAAAVVYAVGQPGRVNVSELVIRPRMQEF